MTTKQNNKTEQQKYSLYKKKNRTGKYTIKY